MSTITTTMAQGDSEEQAALRDALIKKGESLYHATYVQRIRSVLTPHVNLLDIGCGTGHIIQAFTGITVVGLDISPAMLRIAASNTADLSNVSLVQADGLSLPFCDCSFDIVVTRLAEYTPEEAFRVLKRGGYFFEYGLGPEADKEIKEFFLDRIDKEAFFLPESDDWKQEVCEPIKNAGFFVNSVQEYREKEYYQTEPEVKDLIEMVPLVRNFDRKKDSTAIHELAEKYRTKNGIEITWHYYILEAQRL